MKQDQVHLNVPRPINKEPTGSPSSERHSHDERTEEVSESQQQQNFKDNTEYCWISLTRIRYTRRYLVVIDDLLHSYNNTHHRSIGMAPSKVNVDNKTSSEPDSIPWSRNRIGGSMQSARFGLQFTLGDRLDTDPTPHAGARSTNGDDYLPTLGLDK